MLCFPDTAAVASFPGRRSVGRVVRAAAVGSGGSPGRAHIGVRNWRGPACYPPPCHGAQQSHRFMSRLCAELVAHCPLDACSRVDAAFPSLSKVPRPSGLGWRQAGLLGELPQAKVQLHVMTHGYASSEERAWKRLY